MSMEETIREIVRAELRPLVAKLEQLVERAAGDELLSVDEAAKRVGVGASTLRDWIRAGRLPRYGSERKWRVRLSELHALQVASPAVAPDPEEEAARFLAARSS